MGRIEPLWRHGDVFIQSCGAIPSSATLLPHCNLAKGEATGHAHRIAERDAAQLFRQNEMLYLRVAGKQATVMHEEHAPIVLERGNYRVWIQREYSPEAIRRVVD
jgi:hypothetical protein